MSNVFTLDALRQETISRYEPTVFELSDGSTVELPSILRLGKKDRDSVLKSIEAVSELDGESFDDEEEYAEKVCDYIESIFSLVANKPRKLLAELDHEDVKVKVSMYTAVLGKWMGESQLGEAKPSPA